MAAKENLKFSTITQREWIQVLCLVCGERTGQTDQRLGRARIAAWKTHHQHLDIGGLKGEMG